MEDGFLSSVNTFFAVFFLFPKSFTMNISKVISPSRLAFQNIAGTFFRNLDNFDYNDLFIELNIPSNKIREFGLSIVIYH